MRVARWSIPARASTWGVQLVKEIFFVRRAIASPPESLIKLVFAAGARNKPYRPLIEAIDDFTHQDGFTFTPLGKTETHGSRNRPRLAFSR